MYNNFQKFKKFIFNSKLNITDCKNKITNLSTQKVCTDSWAFIEAKTENSQVKNNVYKNNLYEIMHKLAKAVSNIKSKLQWKNILSIPFIVFAVLVLAFFCFQFSPNAAEGKVISEFQIPYVGKPIDNQYKLSYNTLQNKTEINYNTIAVATSITVQSNSTLKIPNEENTSFSKNKQKQIIPISKYESVLASNNNILLNKTATLSTEKCIKIKRPKLEFLPNYFSYTDINQTKLKTYLNNRKSKLAEEPYFSEIISVCKQFNLNPLIMFAITGQEQSFVPKNTSYADQIANNPFNVHGSWKRYNTNIADSTRIAAKTVINLSKGRPSNVDPFTWLNKKYATDQNWSKGVRAIYKMLVEKTT